MRSKRSRSEKWRCVLDLLRRPGEARKSTAGLAKLAGVSRHLVEKARATLGGDAVDPVRVGLDWRTIRTVAKAGGPPRRVVVWPGEQPCSGLPSPAVVDVLERRRQWALEQADCLDFLGSQPDASVDLIMGSPPYCDARTYGRADVARDPVAWVEWMLAVTRQAVRVSKGLVLWVVAGVMRDGCYWPAPEGLCWEWWRSGNPLWRPCIWHKTALPGGGGDQGLRNTWEYVLVFKRAADPLPWADPLATAGRATAGGAGKPIRSRRPNGQRYEQGKPYTPGDANPGNVIRVHSDGRSRASRFAAANSVAPYPEGLPEFFIPSYCPPDGLVCDPFSGSGTTGTVTVRLGRRFVGCDLSEEPVEASRRRIEGLP